MNLHVFFLLLAHLALAGAQDQQSPSQRLLTRETSFEHRRNLGFRRVGRWLRNRWKDTIRIIEDVQEVTGIDRIVHHFTGGKRLFNLDGSYNNELLEHHISEAVVGIEDVLTKTGLDKLQNKITGGCRLLNRDGTFSNGCVEALKELTVDAILDPLIEKAEEIWEDIQKGGNVVLNLIRDHTLTPQEADFLRDVLNDDVNLNDAHRRELGEILQSRILRVVDEIRYGVGFVGGERPVAHFGVGLSCSAGYIAGGNAGLAAFSKIPVRPGEVHDLSVTATVALGVGAQIGGSCGNSYLLSFSEPGSGLGAAVTITAAKFGGISVTFGFGPTKKGFRLGLIAIAPSVGAEFRISASLSYTNLLHTIKAIPINPVSVEKPASHCSNENSECECDGFVRYGYGDRWNMLDQAIDGAVRCNNAQFGDPFPGKKKICQCIPQIYGDHGFHFQLRGKKGDELVTITDNRGTRTERLSTSWKRFSASNADIVIRPTNDNASRDVFLRTNTPSHIRSDDLFNRLKCGVTLSTSDRICDAVRRGQFRWQVNYQVRFTTNLVFEDADGVGGWGGSCTCPDGSVYQVGDNTDSCGSLACNGGISGTCNRHSGEWSHRKVKCGAPYETCDWQCYLDRYEDLQRKFGPTNVDAAAAHWTSSGYAEGRDCTCGCDWQCYLDRYGDLQRKFGATNVDSAAMHWRANGKRQGRDCTCGNYEPSKYSWTKKDNLGCGYSAHGECTEAESQLNIGIDGGYVSADGASVDECKATCEASSECAGFNYQKTSPRKCWFRRSVTCDTVYRNDRDCYAIETVPSDFYPEAGSKQCESALNEFCVENTPFKYARFDVGHNTNTKQWRCYPSGALTVDTYRADMGAMSVSGNNCPSGGTAGIPEPNEATCWGHWTRDSGLKSILDSSVCATVLGVTTTDEWNFVNEESTSYSVSIFSAEEQALLKSGSFEVHCDIKFRLQRDDSASASSFTYLDLDTKTVHTQQMRGGYQNHQRFEMPSCSEITCHKAKSGASCPWTTKNAILLAVDFRPRSGHAHGGDWTRNRFTFTGTHYYVTQAFFKYRLRGRSGSEQVIIPGSKPGFEQRVALSKEWTEFQSFSKTFTIFFGDEEDKQNVEFGADFGSQITSTFWEDWKCGTTGENKRCEQVRRGQFNWLSTYTITLNEKCDWQCYLDRYPVLSRTFVGNRIAKAEQHWKTHGMREGRSCTCN